MNERTTTGVLGRQQTVSRHLGRGPYTLRVMRGRLWMTLDGEPTDWVIAAGESLVVRGPAHLVVEGLEETTWELGLAPRIQRVQRVQREQRDHRIGRAA